MIIEPHSSSDSSLSIDLTPMIDMVFLLLIFFLIATTFHQTEREMAIALPVAGAGEPISTALRELIVNVERDGGIIVAGRRVAPEELSDIITQRVEVNRDQKVSIRGDRAAAYAHVVRVLDICKAAGVSEPFLDTVLTEE